MQNYPALKGKSVKDYFWRIAAGAKSSEVLHKLLKEVKQPSDNFLCIILLNTSCDSTIAQLVLDSGTVLSEQTLARLAPHCKSKELVDKLLSRKEIGLQVSDKALASPIDAIPSMIANVNLSQNDLSKKTSTKLVTTPQKKVNDKVFNELLKHDFLTGDQLLAILEQGART